MARLVSYTPRDENRYSTFGNEATSNSNERLTEFSRVRFAPKLNEEKSRKKCLSCSWCQSTCCNRICRKLRLCCCYHGNNCACDCIQGDTVFCRRHDNSEDWDIDGKFSQIKYEMNLKKLSMSVNSSISSTGPVLPPVRIHIDGKPSHAPYGEKEKRGKTKWSWDDSLRSNSDKFLETLEYDENDGEKTLRRVLKVPRIRNGSRRKEEAQTASADVCSSPLIGNRNVSGSASPIASHGSASSDPWPSQSDEDIDRLVALHQNRSSLSSLGMRSDSMASVYSGAGEGRYGTVTVKGQVEFGMQYNYKQGALEIHVVRCKDLAAVDMKRNRSDPYVKVYLLPDKSKSGKRKTKVKKHTLNPIFDETLRFHMPLSSLESRTLWLTVWHSDMFGRNDFLGEVTINLAGKVFDNPQSQWYLLQERSEPFDDVAVYRGDIIVGLKFIPPESSNSKQSMARGSSSNLRKFGSIKSNSKNISSKGQLHVLVKEAKNLSPVKANGTCDAFCKSYLLPDKTRSSKQKTPVVKRSVNPIWNYTFIYEDVSLQELAERALELTIWDHDRLASNEFLGGVRFSLGTGKHYGKPVDWMDATGKELSLWQNMLNRPNFWVEGGLVLRSSLDGIRALP